MVLLEGLGKMKNPLTSSGIEPATFQLVAALPRERHRAEDKTYCDEVRKSNFYWTKHSKSWAIFL
jgi:hypothetical protein